jgi:hypothetical protein
LDRNPTQKDIVGFLERLKTALQARGLRLRGITTDGSPLYPEPITAVFGRVQHQVCQFHVIAELTKAVLKSVAKIRRNLRAQMPQLPRGRPSDPQAKRKAAEKTRLKTKLTELFDHRHLFVQHSLSPAQKKTLLRVTRGLPCLRTLREIIDEVYRLFDRRCRTDTALSKLDKLRQRVRHLPKIQTTLRKLFSPNLEKALTFLDDSLLPSTSNAVERGNRRYRKMQKTVYRVRTRPAVHGRIALDMMRDQRKEGRLTTLRMLHQCRSG